MVNPVVCGCKLAEDVDEANRLANALLLELPLLPEQLLLLHPVAKLVTLGSSSKIWLLLGLAVALSSISDTKKYQETKMRQRLLLVVLVL